MTADTDVPSLARLRCRVRVVILVISAIKLMFMGNSSCFASNSLLTLEDNEPVSGKPISRLAVEFAEAMAEWVNRKIKSELNIGEKRGLRYSWGYPSCPDILQHRLVWKLLEPEKSDMTLTESGQIIPEQSTAAIIIHHPEAEYFVL